jgi:hypothetical protein
MHGDLLMAMDSSDSSRRQRQAGLACGRQIEVDLFLDLGLISD